MSDEIFQVNSSSIQTLIISSSLIASEGIVVNFNNSTVIGNFSGSGVNLENITASYILPESNVTSSLSLSSSYLIPGSTLYVVSGSNGVPPCYLEPYDYSIGPLYNPPYKEGRTFWDSKYKDWKVFCENSGIGIHLGRETTFGVYNPSLSPLTKLTAVYLSGSSFPTDFRPDVHPAIADGGGLKSSVIGLVRYTIPAQSFGYIILDGVIHNSDVTQYGGVGTELWLSNTTPGELITSKPGQPYENVFIGFVTEAGVQGSALIEIQKEPVPLNAYAGLTSSPEFTDDTGSNSIYLTGATVNLFSNENGSGVPLQYSLLPTTFSVAVAQSTQYITANYGSGTASYAITSDLNSINHTTKVLVASVYRADVDTHWLESSLEGLALANKLNKRLQRTDRFVRETGLILDSTGSRYYTVSGGKLWYGATEHIEVDFDSRLTGSLSNPILHETHFLYSSASAWTSSIGGGQYQNGYYDNGENLVPLTLDAYTTNYFFRILGENPYDEDVFIFAGNNEYSSSVLAQNDNTPSNIPSVVSDNSILVGRIIIKSGSNTPDFVESAFTTNFGTSNTLSHENLTGLQGGIPGEHNHLTNSEYIGEGTGLFVRKIGAKITGSISEAISASYSLSSGMADSLSFIPNNSISSSYAVSSSLCYYALESVTSSLAIKSLSSDSSSISQVSINSYTSSIATSSSFSITASYALNSISDIPVSSSWASSSLSSSYGEYATSSSYSDLSKYSELSTSSSWASASVSSSYSNNTFSSSYSLTSSFALNVPNITTVPSSSWASSSISSSYSTNAGTAYAINFGIINSISSSYASSSVSSSYSTNAETAYAINFTPVNAISSSFASSSLTSSYAENSNQLNGQTGGFYQTASNLISGFISPSLLTGSYSITSSWSNDSVTSSHAEHAKTASFATNFTSNNQFSRGATIYNSSFIPDSPQNIYVWHAPFPCTVSSIECIATSLIGTTNSASINARINNIGTILSSSFSLTASNSYVSLTALQTSSISTSDSLEIMLIGTIGKVNQVNIQVNFIR